MRGKDRPAFVLVLLGLAVVAASGCFGNDRDEWHVPAWRAGDIVSWTSDLEGGQKPVHIERVLRGPDIALDEEGTRRSVHWWEDHSSGQKLGLHRLWDVQRGRGIQVVEDPISLQGIEGSIRLIGFGPREAGSEGIALQGTVLRVGDDFTYHAPDGRATEFHVAEVQNERASLEVLHRLVDHVPPFHLSADDKHREIRYELEFTDIHSPYPASIRVYARTGQQAWQHVNTITSEIRSLAAGDRHTVREATDDRFATPNLALRRGAWAQSMRPLPGVDGRLDADAVFKAAEADSALDEFRGKHPDASLVDVRYYRVRTASDPDDARVWNLTWLDPKSGDAFAFVRVARTGDAQSIIPNLTSDPDATSRFLDWRSGPFRMSVRLERAMAPLDAVELAEAMRAYTTLEPNMPRVVGLRWTRLILEFQDDWVLSERITGVGNGSAIGVAIGTMAADVGPDGAGSFTQLHVRSSWLNASSGQWIQAYLRTGQ